MHHIRILCSFCIARCSYAIYGRVASHGFGGGFSTEGWFYEDVYTVVYANVNIRMESNWNECLFVYGCVGAILKFI